MSLTSDGALALTVALRDRLAAGAMRVSDGSDAAQAQIVTAELDDAVLIVSATFGEQEANFAWTSREVLDAAGVVLDREEIDLGRKAPGTVWTLEAAFDVAGS